MVIQSEFTETYVPKSDKFHDYTLLKLLITLLCIPLVSFLVYYLFKWVSKTYKIEHKPKIIDEALQLSTHGNSQQNDSIYANDDPDQPSSHKDKSTHRGKDYYPMDDEVGSFQFKKTTDLHNWYVLIMVQCLYE